MTAQKQQQQQQQQQQQRQQQQQQQQQQRQQCQQNQRVPPHASKGGSVTGMPLEYYGKDSGNYFSAQEVSGLYSRPYSNLPAGFSRGGIYATFPGRLAGGGSQLARWCYTCQDAEDAKDTNTKTQTCQGH